MRGGAVAFPHQSGNEGVLRKRAGRSRPLECNKSRQCPLSGLAAPGRNGSDVTQAWGPMPLLFVTPQAEGCQIHECGAKTGPFQCKTIPTPPGLDL